MEDTSNPQVTNHPQTSALTDFGFQSIPLSEKSGRVQGLFQKVAQHYDRMNTVMSGGLHHLWKKKFVAGLPLPQSPFHLLDMASGTGDIGKFLIQRAVSLKCAPFEMTFCDLTEKMLAIGKKKLESQAYATFFSSQIQWVCGNAEALPLADACVDIYTIAFGLRNIANKEKALQEAHRVLKPGGHFFCLEFSQVKQPLLLPAYDFYAFQLIPRLGSWIAKEREAYQYLVESIKKFPSQKLLSYMLKDAGFAEVNFQNLSQGIVAIHQGRKNG